MKGMTGEAASNRKTVIVEFIKEGGKAIDQVKTSLKETFTLEKHGLKVSGVHKGRNGVHLILADGNSWQTVEVRSLKIGGSKRRLPLVGCCGFQSSGWTAK